MAKSTTLNKITMDSELKETLVCHGNGALPQSRDQLSIDESRSFKCRRFFKNNAFLIFVFAGIIAGFVIGIAARQAQADADAAVWIGLPGELYMRILTATILPLIICTVIEGTSVGDPVSSGRIGLISFLYIALTNALGGVIGVLITYVFKPSALVEKDEEQTVDRKNLNTADIFADFIRNMFPANIVEATMFQTQTQYTANEQVTLVNISGQMTNVTSLEMTKSLGVARSTNILGLVVCCTAIGMAASQIGEKGVPFVSFIRSASALIFKLFSWIQWIAPIGVASLVAKALVNVTDIYAAVRSMGWFVLAVVTGNVMMQLILLPLIYFVLVRKNPVHFLVSCAKPWLLAFGPPSSLMAYPELMRISLDHYRVDKRVCGFVLPFAATLNRDGSCMFIVVACLYVAEFGGVPMDVTRQLLTCILSILSSFAIPAVNSASIVSILIILNSLGIPPVNIGLILAVDWISDRVRTTTNVVGHLAGVLITWRFSKQSLRDLDQQKKKQNDSNHEAQQI